MVMFFPNESKKTAALLFLIHHYCLKETWNGSFTSKQNQEKPVFPQRVPRQLELTVLGPKCKYQQACVEVYSSESSGWGRRLLLKVSGKRTFQKKPNIVE